MDSETKELLTKILTVLVDIKTELLYVSDYHSHNLGDVCSRVDDVETAVEQIKK